MLLILWAYLLPHFNVLCSQCSGAIPHKAAVRSWSRTQGKIHEDHVNLVLIPHATPVLAGLVLEPKPPRIYNHPEVDKNVGYARNVLWFKDHILCTPGWL